MATTLDKVELLVVGDYSVGKTSLLHHFTQGCFPEEVDPNPGNYGAIHRVLNTDVWFSQQDTDGGDYDQIRLTNYPGADVIMLCYDVTNFATFSLTAQSKWVPELRKHSAGVPVILVGTKVDLRQDGEVKLIISADDTLESDPSSVSLSVTETSGGVEKSSDEGVGSSRDTPPEKRLSSDEGMGSSRDTPPGPSSGPFLLKLEQEVRIASPDEGVDVEDIQHNTGSKDIIEDKHDICEPITKETDTFIPPNRLIEGVTIELVEQLKAIAYLECSAVTGKGVKEVFEKALEVGYKHVEKNKDKKKDKFRARFEGRAKDYCRLL